jgi:hypothetical protein
MVYIRDSTHSRGVQVITFPYLQGVKSLWMASTPWNLAYRDRAGVSERDISVHYHHDILKECF